MIARVRDFDWSRSPLGDTSGWSPELIAAASFVLESKFPAALVWGADYTTIYNDAFRPILGDKPEALGRSFKDVWAEAWPDLEPIVTRAFAGEATYLEDFPLKIERFGQPEQVNFTFCYSPVRLADGTVAGMIDTVIETTGAMKAKDRASLLNKELGHRQKNTMSLVQAIAFQSLKDVIDRAAVEAFSRRIGGAGRSERHPAPDKLGGCVAGPDRPQDARASRQ